MIKTEEDCIISDTRKKILKINLVLNIGLIKYLGNYRKFKKHDILNICIDYINGFSRKLSC